MKQKAGQFIVLAFGEKGVRYGVNRSGEGQTFPLPIAELLVSSKADCWDFTREGCVAYFLRRRRPLRLLHSLVACAEHLRASGFPTLGIGLAHGHLIGQCNWFGKLKSDFKPDADTVNRALAGIQGAQTYTDVLKDLASE